MVRIFVTGGTFDKRYNELDGTLTFQGDASARDAAARTLPASMCRSRR